MNNVEKFKELSVMELDKDLRELMSFPHYASGLDPDEIDLALRIQSVRNTRQSAIAAERWLAMSINTKTTFSDVLLNADSLTEKLEG